MKKLLFVLVLAIILGIAGFVFLLNPRQDITTNTIANVVSDESGSSVKTLVFTGVNFKFFMKVVENPEIRVKEGERVRIDFTSTDGFHDWKIDEFNAATQKVNTGGSSYVEFTADKKGTFEYYCSVGKHRDMGMFGKFIVE